MKSIIAVAGLVVLLVSCGTTSSAGGGAPGWMLDLENDYPSDDYIAAVGNGSSRRAAEDSAAGAIARRIRVTVNNQTESRTRILELSQNSSVYTETQSELLDTITTNTGNQSFVNLQFSEPYTDSMGRVHVVAFMERQSTAQIYAELIDADLELTQTLVNRSRNARSGLEQFALLDTALAISRNTEFLLEQLQIIREIVAVRYRDQLLTNRILEARGEVAQQLGFEVDIEGDRDGKITALVRQTLSDLGFAAGGNRAVAVLGTISMEPVDVNPDFESVRWTLQLSLIDDQDNSLVNIFEEERENAITIAEAEAFAIGSIEDVLSRRFVSDFYRWVDSLSMGNN